MNFKNRLQIETTILPQVLDRSIIEMNTKYYNRLSSKIMLTQINMFNM
jgi:hypothetical protein